MLYFAKYILDASTSLKLALSDSLKKELEDGDFPYTGKLENFSIYRPSTTLNELELEFYFEDYGLLINEGYTSEMAIERSLDGGGKKKYINELYYWWRKKKGKDDKEAERLAHATFWAHIHDGYYSRRSPGNEGFIDFTLDNMDYEDHLLNPYLFLDALYYELLTLSPELYKHLYRIN